jgi:hypothetical protein
MPLLRIFSVCALSEVVEQGHRRANGEDKKRNSLLEFRWRTGHHGQPYRSARRLYEPESNSNWTGHAFSVQCVPP